MIWKLEQILNILKEDIIEQGILSDEPLKAVKMNSLDIEKGDIFIALDGSRKGSQFIPDAIKGGANLCITHDKINTKDKVLIVKDAYQALLKLAKYKRDNHKATFIGITGSVGKTSTKEAFGAALSKFGKTFVSPGNFNNHLGLPLNLASLPDDIEFVVLEMGMNHAGEISFLTKLARPSITIITIIGITHIEFFKDINGIADAKAEIFEGQNEQGIALLNKDDPFYPKLFDKASHLKKIYSFGKSQADGRMVNINRESNYSFVEAIINGKKISFKTSLRGEHRIFNLIPTLLLIDILNLDIYKASESFLHFDIAEGRGNIINVSIENKKITLINDAYNAGPASTKEALKDFANFEGFKRKIAILADMRELGEFAPQAHAELSEYIKADMVICIGDLMLNLYNNLPEKVKYHHFKDVDELNKVILSLIEDKDIILFKGSKSMRLRDCIKVLTEAGHVL